MNAFKNYLIVGLVGTLLAACGTRPPAPVVDRTATTREPIFVPPQRTIEPIPAPVVVAPPIPASADQHIVRRGETIYSIARVYNLSSRELAQWNGLPPDAVVREGQILRIQQPVGMLPPPLIATPIPALPSQPIAPAGEVKREPKAQKQAYSDEALAKIKGTSVSALRAGAVSPVVSIPTAQVAPVVNAPSAPTSPAVSTAPGERVANPSSATSEADSITWQWPVAGKVIKKFSETAVMKGLGVDGKAGTPIYAAAAGKVAYTGENLRGYGKMIILRHNDQYTTVYGHNSTFLVKEGQTVKRGQQIAEMGNTEADTTKLHFEIRRGGKPLDPEKILPAK